MKNKILIVDDELANLRLLERLFGDSHEIITATSGVEALEILTLFDAAVIITDQRMPGMTGIEFLKKAAELRPHTVRIILTGYTDVSDLVEAINSSVVYKYITKPWVNTDLVQTVNRAVEHYGATKNQHLMSLENERLEKRLKVTVEGFINGMREMISYKNSALAEHCRRTSHHAKLIAVRMGLDTEQVEELTFASLLHEVPNMRMPFEMAFTKTALTPEQHRVTRNNYENGLRLISNVPDLNDVAEIIRFQHEHYDGTGFFDGLDGDRIPIQSRILAVANAFDEISSGRNPALLRSGEAAADWLRRRSGIEFDPQVVETCLTTQLIETAGGPVDMRPLEQLRSGVSIGL
jgi:response regulator RpfG family c-di-GMP phosphodiesterase